MTMTRDLSLPADLFQDLPMAAPDVLLSLIRLYREDPRPGKIDLGVGVYRDGAGETPVFAAVKAAEARLLAEQRTKAYLGAEGDVDFLAAITPIIFGARSAAQDLFPIQTPGGMGALRLAAEVINVARSGAGIMVGAPSWPGHGSIFSAVGLQVTPYPCFDTTTQTLLFEPMLAALASARCGDVVLLQGGCHNPTGADLSLDQWRAVTQVIAERGLVPLIDLAYQGLGQGLEADAAGTRIVLEAVDTALVAYSCDKNFGLYRERTGALFLRARHQAETVRSNALKLARCNWSMPPDHGAAVVRIILQDEGLTALWRQELDGMRARLRKVREHLAQQLPVLGGLAEQNGIFALLPLSPEDVAAMRADHGVYMAGTGRINLAGLTDDNLSGFVTALRGCRPDLFA
jgi:aromatic-amino-acid transaminase